jgi:hypothetical protein
MLDVDSTIATFLPRTVREVHREFPNGVLHTLRSVDDASVRPSELHPAFFGCFDWHSAVHSHWQLVRVLRRFPALGVAADAEAALDRSLTPEHLAVEVAYVRERGGWEMPYGMAWLLRLAAELHEWDDARADRWGEVIDPLRAHAVEQFARYLDRRAHPVRSGVHSQSAFALGLVHDYASSVGDPELAGAIHDRAIAWFGDDVDAPVHVEPSAADFLSPTLAEADLMRRLLAPDEFGDWLGRFLGPGGVDRVVEHLQPVGVTDHADGQLAHFAGLNMSRAWMLGRIGAAIDSEALRALADDHRDVGLPSALHDDYMVSHWAPTFVVYLLTDA